MNESDYIIKRAEIGIKYHDDQRDLDAKYALSRSTVEIGDVVSDERNVIRVDKIMPALTSDRSGPQCCYSGLTSDGGRACVCPPFKVMWLARDEVPGFTANGRKIHEGGKTTAPYADRMGRAYSAKMVARWGYYRVLDAQRSIS